MRTIQWVTMLACGIGLGVVQGAGAAVFDSDNDGMPDDLDLCPYSPGGAWIDSQGCAQDTDLDGVADGIDRCANTPVEVRADDTGCAEGQVAAEQPHAPQPGDSETARTLDDLPEVDSDDLYAHAQPAAAPEKPVDPASIPAPPAPSRPPALEPDSAGPGAAPDASPVAESASSESPASAGADAGPDALTRDTEDEAVGITAGTVGEETGSRADTEPEQASESGTEPTTEPTTETEQAIESGTETERPALTLFFAAAQADLDSRLSRDLSDWVAAAAPLLESDPRLQLAVSGHADIKHDGLDAARVAARRAQAVREELGRQGIAAHRIRMRVAGIVEPRFHGAALAQNSRVELGMLQAPVQTAAARAVAVSTRGAETPPPGAVYRVPFARRSTFLDEAARAALDTALQDLLESLRLTPRAPLRVRGFSVAREAGPDSARLAGDRARAVRAYLVSRGIGVQRIDAVGSATPRGAFAELSVAPD